MKQYKKLPEKNFFSSIFYITSTQLSKGKIRNVLFKDTQLSFQKQFFLLSLCQPFLPSQLFFNLFVNSKVHCVIFALHVIYWSLRSKGIMAKSTSSCGTSFIGSLQVILC